MSGLIIGGKLAGPAVQRAYHDKLVARARHTDNVTEIVRGTISTYVLASAEIAHRHCSRKRKRHPPGECVACDIERDILGEMPRASP